MDATFFQDVLDQVHPELVNLAVALILALLVQGLRAAGMVISSSAEGELDAFARRGIALVEEEAAKMANSGEPMTSREKLAMAKAYTFGEINKHKSAIMSALMGWLFSSFKRPDEVAVVNAIHANLASMKAGALHGDTVSGVARAAFPAAGN